MHKYRDVFTIYTYCFMPRYQFNVLGFVSYRSKIAKQNESSTCMSIHTGAAWLVFFFFFGFCGNSSNQNKTKKKVYTLYLCGVIRISASAHFFVRESDIHQNIFRSRYLKLCPPPQNSPGPSYPITKLSSYIFLLYCRMLLISLHLRYRL